MSVVQSSRITSSARVLVLLLLTLAVNTPIAMARDVGGIPFAERVRIGDTDLMLNGAGVRSKFMFRIYAMALYLPQRSSDAVAVIALSGPRQVRLVTLREVSAELFLEGLRKGLEKNHGEAELIALKPQIDAFSVRLLGLRQLGKGSVVELDFLPGIGTRLMVNAKPVGEPISGDAFARALLRIWIGDAPASDALKQALLGF